MSVGELCTGRSWIAKGSDCAERSRHQLPRLAPSVDPRGTVARSKTKVADMRKGKGTCIRAPQRAWTRGQRPHGSDDGDPGLG